MDVVHSCRCCLRCPPDRDMTTPYSHLGKMEIYSDMLKECFDLHMRVEGDVGTGGICTTCVGRLRDASDFKLQVQRSQAELRALLLDTLLIIKIEPETELAGNEGTGNEPKCEVFHEEPIIKIQPICENETGEDNLSKDPLVKSEPADVQGEDTSASGPWPVPMHYSGHGATPESSTTTLKHTCDTCGEHFAGKSSLIAHVRGHLARDESAATYSCSEFPTEDLPANHTATVTENTYACDKCTEQFTEKPLLTKHKKTHLKHYLCRVCDETFTMRSVFKQHKRSHKTFSCKECNKTFTMKTNLYKHKRIHTGEKPYACQYCDKLFAFKTGYDSHVRIHTGDKPYGCEICHKQFRQKGDLNRHKRVHTGVKPYHCEECDRRFSMKSHLTTHKRIHSGGKPYSCDVCRKRFSRLDHLTAHKRIHVGEKPFACDVCNKQFTRKCDVDRHKETHTGEKPYKCDTCNMFFSRKSSLVRHAAKHKASSCEVGVDTSGDISSALTSQPTNDLIDHPEVKLE